MKLAAVTFALGLAAATSIAAAQSAAAPAAAASAAAPAAPAVTTATCVTCHTADGSRGQPAFPIVAGQHADYVVKQLTEFKSGKRVSPIMQPMAAGLSEADMKSMAAFYATKQAQPGFATSKQTVALGEQIYRGGVGNKQIPACAGCHSPNGAGIPAQYPRLAGQHREYTEAQLNAFRTGARANSAQMQAIAAKMSDAEIKAVADYIAGLR